MARDTATLSFAPQTMQELAQLGESLVAQGLGIDVGSDEHRHMTQPRLADLLAYKQRDLPRRRRIAAELTAESQEMGLYD